MSDSKKYYYLKLKDNFYNEDSIQIIESMENGYIYSNILMKMYLKSLKREGKLMITDTVPYSLDMLAKVINHDRDHVRTALDIFKEFDLIEVLESGEIYMIEIQNYIGHSSSEADRKRLYRSKIKQIKDKCPDISPPEIEKEKEKEIELKREIKKKKDIEYPSFDEFKIYAIEKASELQFRIDDVKLKLKYQAWSENNWINGNDKKIKNWKTTLLNTLVYLRQDSKEKKQSGQTWESNGRTYRKNGIFTEVLNDSGNWINA